MLTDEDLARANEAGERFYRDNPHAVSARYDETRHRIVVMLSSDLEIAFDPADTQGLEHATPAQLAEVIIDGVGFGLHWPSLDADVYVPSLLKGITGTKAWMARRQAQKEAA